MVVILSDYRVRLRSNMKQTPPGKQPEAARFDPATDTLMVIDIGGTHVKLGHVRASEIRPDATSRRRTEAIRTTDPVGALTAMANDHARHFSLDPALYIVTIPGLIDLDFDRVLRTSNVPELEGRRLASELQARLHAPVTLERDAVLMLQGECSAGAARHSDSVLGIFLGTGVGAALQQGGHIFRGRGWALELGHVPATCDCASNIIGSDSAIGAHSAPRLEDRASGVVLKALADTWQCPVENVFEIGKQDPDRRATLRGLVKAWGHGIATASTLFSPEIVVIGGGLVQMPRFPWTDLLADIDAHSPNFSPAPRTDIRRSSLGWQATLHGALAAQTSGTSDWSRF